MDLVTTDMQGRRLLRVEARNAGTPIERKPAWIRTTVRMGPEYTQIAGLVAEQGLHTVCQEAGCPNIFECWEDREATFLIGGDQCTRRCDFCQIDTGKPQPLDRAEPQRVAASVHTMGLRYATVTGVARDD
ncbi:MAG: lipoyl synthase, partial [Actinomycetales bacterium]